MPQHSKLLNVIAIIQCEKLKFNRKNMTNFSFSDIVAAKPLKSVFFLDLFSEEVLVLMCTQHTHLHILQSTQSMKMIKPNHNFQVINVSM